MKEPSIVTENHNGTNTMSIADKLLQDNEIWLEGEITISAVDTVISLLHILENRAANSMDGIINADVRLLIAGPGGSASAALNLANYLKHTPLSVTTVAVNNCSSSSALIWLAGEERQIFPYSRLMFHEVRHITVEDSRYKVDRIKEIHDDMTRLNDEIYKLIGEQIGIDKEDVEEMIAGKDFYLSAQEALHLGFATEIVDTL
uniref:ClpP family protease n=1 Tax=Acetatifactor sp. TaxID=1872090 RepID=UPI0040568C79